MNIAGIIEDAKKTILERGSHLPTLYIEFDDGGIAMMICADFPVERAILHRERVATLYEALAHLPEPQRTIIQEHYGLSGEEVAQRQLCYKYSVPVASMHRLIHRSLDTLATALRDPT